MDEEKKPESEELFGPVPPFADVPFAEWKARIDKAKLLMRKENIDLLVLWHNRNIRYFAAYTSTHWETPSIPPLLALLPVDGDPVALTGEFFLSTAQAQTWIKDIRTISKGYAYSEKSLREIPIEVAAVVRAMGYGKAKIALEMGPLGGMFIPRPLNDIQAFMNGLPSAKFVDGDKVIWGCRGIKSPLEIDRLTMAASIHRQAMSAVIQGFRPGMTESDVGTIFICHGYQRGAESVTSGHIMCGAEKEGMVDTKHSFDGVTIHKGDYLSLDMAVSYKGYWADMARIINVGPVTAEFRKYSEQLADSFDAIVEAVRPGMTVGELQKAVYGHGGMETEQETGGHGIGLDIHEPPFISYGSEEVLEPGMTLELEPFLFHGFRKLGGIGLFHYENLIIITERGCTPVFSLPRGILQVTNPFQ